MGRKKDNVDLICDIGELAGLFEKSRNLDDFLQTVVSVVAYHMASAVCSVYLLDENRNELVLTANQGLNNALIGTLRLHVGEGLTGTAIKELRSINAGVASGHPNYKYIPGSNEEKFESFLAVPILRGLKRIGVLVVQDTQRDYFDENDTKALQAIATQLATTIQSAKLFMSLYERGDGVEVIVEGDDEMPLFFKGVVASPGIAWGRAIVIGGADSYMKLTEDLSRQHCTQDDFYRAFKQTELQIEVLQRNLEEGLSDVASLIFSAHLLMLKDEKFQGDMIGLIEEGHTPQQAITDTVNQYVAMFARNQNPLFQEKVQDIKDVGHRLLHNLLQKEDFAPDYAGEVVIGAGLLPSDIVKLSTQHAAALIMVDSTITSHLSILARSMELPVVLIEDNRIFEILDGTPLLVDASVGSVFVDPGDDITNKYRASFETHDEVARVAQTVEDQTLTRDRIPIRLRANINLLNELPLALQYKAEGIGLYRSEFPFIVRSDFPSEEEQYRIYRRIAEIMQGKPITLRTLDIGGDKMLSYFPTVNEANPFLGLRAIRFTLKNKDIFVHQLRAMLRSGHDADLRIMFPMIASVDEFIQAKEIVNECCEALASQGVKYNASPGLGPMIELPSAVEVANELALVSDFLCVGTNDLIQYILAVDRTNESIADYYVPYHPAVLRALKRVADAGRQRDVPVSICGEMASDTKLTSFLIGIGIRELSMDMRRIPELQRKIGSISTRKARVEADVMLNYGRISELKEYLDRSGEV